MGHRKSHSRASKRETLEVTPPKEKHNAKEGGNKACDKSRQEKRERKRKREHEDASKQRRKERHKGKNRHHHSSKSTTREKPKDKASRWKDGRSSDNMSLESDSSTSFLSSRGAHHRHHSRSHSHSADVPRKRSRSCSGDAPKRHRLKKFKENNEALNMDDGRKTYEASYDPKWVEKDGMQQCVNTLLTQEKDSAEGAFSSESRRCHMSTQKNGCDMTISRYQEQEKGLDGIKDKVLEVELRQKALANFLRHQDTSCKMEEHKERISPTSYVGTTRPASNVEERNERTVTEVDSRWTAGSLVLSNASNVEASIDDHRWPRASDTVVSVHLERPIEGSGLACDSHSNLEEGEISSDTAQSLNENETGNGNASSQVDEGKVLYEQEKIEKEGPHADRDVCKEGHKSSPSSTGEVERASAPGAACINKKQALSQENEVEGDLNVDPPATAQHDGSTAFEQKTMSVMRGGEMVQVNYKVYIPKRAAELARRRLHR
eukprot:c19999_g1_i1 orf=356-1828(-)